MRKDIVLKIKPLSIEDLIGKSVSKMQELKIEALPVFSNKYEGMVYLKDIVTRDLDANAKLKNFVRDVPHLTEKKGEEEFANYNVLPFFLNNSFSGIVLLIDFLKTLDIEIDLNKVCEETEIISANETIGVARNLLRERDVLLISDKNKIIGAVDCFSLAKIISIKKDRVLSPDKKEEKEIKISDFVKRFVEVDSKIETDELLKLIKENYFVVYKDKIITPKTIFRGLKKLEEKTKIELVGFDLEEGIYTDVIYKDLNNFAEKIQKILKPNLIKFHLRKLRKTGKPLYEIDGRIIAGGKVFETKVTGYGLIDLVQKSIDKLEVQVMKVKD